MRDLGPLLLILIPLAVAYVVFIVWFLPTGQQ